MLSAAVKQWFLGTGQMARVLLGLEDENAEIRQGLCTEVALMCYTLEDR